MAHIGLCICHIDIRCALFIERGEIIGPFFVAHIHNASRGKYHTVATIAGGHHAIKHIYTSVYAFEYIGRRTHTHQVSRLVGGEYVVDNLYHLIHLLGRLAYSQSSYGIAICTQVGYKLGSLSA